MSDQNTNPAVLEQSTFLPTPQLEDTLDQKRVLQLADQLNIKDSKSILDFGTDSQRQLTSIADTMLNDVKSKDTGAAGQLLSEMVVTLRGFQGAELRVNDKPGLWDRLLGKTKPFQLFLQKFEGVSDQIDQISNNLEVRKQQLLVDVSTLDHLYEATLGYFRDLRYHIAAGEQVLAHADSHSLPALKEHAKTSNTMESTQRLRDFQTHRDELERRLHDMRLTKQVAMQALPSIRMIQENDKGLVNKINTTLVNTVPLWRQQLAQSIAIYRSGEAAKVLKDSADLTNELLKNNAETLKTSNKEARIQLERGVFDIETVEAANKLLIETIEESISLHEQAQTQRAEAEKRLDAAEQELKQALQQASQARTEPQTKSH